MHAPIGDIDVIFVEEDGCERGKCAHCMYHVQCAKEHEPVDEGF